MWTLLKDLGVYAVKSFFDKSKTAINIIDIATSPFEKRTSPLVKYIFIALCSLFPTILDDNGREALTHIVSYFLNDASLNIKIIVCTLIFIVLLFIKDIICSPVNNLKIAYQCLCNLVKRITLLLFKSLLFVVLIFRKKYRKQVKEHIALWWQKQVLNKEYETLKSKENTMNLKQQIDLIQEKIKLLDKN